MHQQPGPLPPDSPPSALIFSDVFQMIFNIHFDLFPKLPFGLAGWPGWSGSLVWLAWLAWLVWLAGLACLADWPGWSGWLAGLAGLAGWPCWSGWLAWILEASKHAPNCLRGLPNMLPKWCLENHANVVFFICFARFSGPGPRAKNCLCWARSGAKHCLFGARSAGKQKLE